MLKASERVVVKIVVCSNCLKDGDGLVLQGIVRLDSAETERWRHGLDDAGDWFDVCLLRNNENGRAEMVGDEEVGDGEERPKMGGCRTGWLAG